MFLALAVCLTLEITGGSGMALPNIKDFRPILSKKLEFRIDDYKTAFVGRVIDYQNPNDPNEFVRVYYRQVAIVSERAQEKNSTEGSQDTNLSNYKYHSQEETEVLGRVQKTTDAFAYVQWRTVRDPRTGQDIRADFLRSWLLDQNGNWMLTYGSDYNLFISPLSEPSKADPKKRIIVGIQFTLSGGVHIVRIDQDEIVVSAKENDNDKK